MIKQNSRRVGFLTLGILLAAGLFVVGPGIAQVDAAARNPEPGVSAATCLASEEAPAPGISINEARTRFCGVGEFTALVNRLQETLGDDLVDAEWGYGEGSLMVRPGSAGAFAAAMVSTAVPVSVTEVDLPNQADQARLVDSAIQVIVLCDPQASAMAGFDARLGSVVVGIGDSSLDAATRATLTATVAFAVSATAASRGFDSKVSTVVNFGATGQYTVVFDDRERS